MLKESFVSLISLDQVQTEFVKWLWPGRVPLGKVTILLGDPGIGKSTITLDIASRCSKNESMPDGSVGDLDQPATVFLLSAEDGAADTIRPRLDAVGAASENIHIPKKDDQFLIPRDSKRIRDAVEQIGAKLLVIDPLAAFLDGAVNSWNNHHVRRALRPLTELADATGAAILAVDHLNKRSGVSAIQRGSGSMAFNGVARSVLLASKHPTETDSFVLARVKGNLAAPSPSLMYRTTEGENKAVRIEWTGECPYEADELVAVGYEVTGSKKLQQSKDFLKARIPVGTSALGKVVEAEAKERGLASRTLARARQELGVKAHPVGRQGEWIWEMPLVPPKTS